MMILCIRLLVLSWLLCFSPSYALGQTGADWPYVRHDLQLTGRSPAVGNMREPPVERWKYYLGGWKNEFVVTYVAGMSSTSSIAARVDGVQAHRPEEPAWDGPALVDLAGDGKLVSSPQGKISKLLPDVRGLQQVIWEHPPGEPTRGVGRCYAFDGGAEQPRLVWETEVEPEVYELLWTIADLDGDKLPEVVFMTHYRVLVYNGQTGEKKSTIQWPIGRNYGQMTLADVDGDQLPEVVVVVDSPPHVDVLKYLPGEGKLLWSHRYITDAQVSLPIEIQLRLIPDHVQDIDGDGRPEILYNLFNADNDFQWHVIVRDALTGREKFDLPRTFLWGTVDLGGATRSLCCLEAPGRGLPHQGTAKIISLENGILREQWRGERVRWQMEPYQWPLTEFTIASLGPVAQSVPRVCDVDGDGNNEIFVSRDDRIVEAIGQGGDGKLTVKWSLTASAASRISVDRTSRQTGAVRVNIDAPSGDLAVQNGSVQQVSHEVRRDFSPLPTRPLAMIADLDADGRNEVIVQDAHWQTRILRCDEGQPRELRRLRGGGLWLGRRWEEFPYSKFPVFTADVNGDGRRELLLTDVDEETVSTVTCHDADGQVLWRRPLPDTPARGIVWMAVGNFLELSRVDLVVVVQSGSIGECFCLHGETGDILWRMGELALADGTPFNFGSHSPYLGVADWDGDGLSDLGGQSGQYIALVRGKDGKPLVTPRSMIHDLFPRWVNYGVNVIGDWDGSGRLAMFTNTTTNGFGLVDPQLGVKWFTDRDGQPNVRNGAIGRSDAKGPWVFGTFAESTFLTFDMTTGKPIVSEPIAEIVGQVTSDVICADIDGDGSDEFLATSYDRLLCIRSGSAPGARLKWQVQLPTMPSELAVADVDHDGLPEIVYTGVDGYLHCLGSAVP